MFHFGIFYFLTRSGECSFISNAVSYNGQPGQKLQAAYRCGGDEIVASKYIVRHGTMRFLGEFEPAGELSFRRGDQVIVPSQRGREFGEVMGAASPHAVQRITE